MESSTLATFQDAYEKVGASVLPVLHPRLLSQADFSTPCLECTFVFLGYISYLDCSAACQGFLDLLDSWVEYRAFLGHPFL